MNPMMMQMAQLQGLNPLIAMNLYPPLIPPNLLKQQAGGGNDLLAQLQSNPLFQATAGGAGGPLDPKLLALMSAARGQQDQQQPQQPPQPQKNQLAQMMGLLGQSPTLPGPAVSQESPSKSFL